MSGKTTRAGTRDAEDRLRHENEELRARLEEAEATLRALASGEVDAVVVAERDRVYTLETPDLPYRLAVEQMRDPAVTLADDGTIIYANRRFAEQLGALQSELAGKPLVTFVSSSSKGAFETLLRDVGRGTDGVQAAITLQGEAGMPIHVCLGASTLNAGALGRCLVVCDLTTQRQYEELRRTQEQRQQFVLLAETSNEFIGMCDMEFQPFFVNEAGLRLVGLDSLDQALRTPVQEFFFPEDQDFIMNEYFPRVLREGHGDLEIRFRHFKTGEALWMQYTVSVLKDPSGKPTGLAAVSRNITERRRVEEALKLADRRKDEFVATLAHELRNPLAPIRNAVQILKTKGLPEDLQWSGGVIDRQVNIMARLLEDLLDVSRISLHKLELRRERVELAAVVEAALETSRPLIQASKHVLTVSLPARPVMMDVDPVRVAQVLSNLLNNAAKYTEEGGQIELTAQTQDKDLILSVKDSGIGISSEMLPRLFEMFAQAKTAMVRSQGGLGIGLALVKGLVELHGGTVDVRSAGLGRGSEFIVRLPGAAVSAST